MEPQYVWEFFFLSGKKKESRFSAKYFFVSPLTLHSPQGIKYLQGGFATAGAAVLEGCAHMNFPQGI